RRPALLASGWWRAGHTALAATGPARRRDGLADGLLLHPEPAGELTGVLGAQRAVADAGDDGGGGPQPGDPALRGVEVHPAQHGADREREQRFTPVDELTD